MTDDIRDMWKPSCTEATGIPPLLTMPGVQLSTDLVCRCTYVWMLYYVLYLNTLIT